MAEILDDVAYLSQEIGPRPAGTEEEQQAALFIADQVHKRTNLEAEIEDISCNANAAVVDIIYFGVAFLALLFSLVLPGLGGIWFLISLIFTVCFLAEEKYHRPVLSRFLNRDASQNVVAKYRPEAAVRSGSRRKIILVANYDSGKVKNDLKPGLLKAWSVLGHAADIAMIAAPIVLFFKNIVFAGALGFVSGFFGFLTLVAAVLVVIPVIRALIHRTGAYNEAANMNASSVAVLLNLMERASGNAAAVPSAEAQGAAAPAQPDDQPVVHGPQAAAAADVVPEGAQLQYDDDVATPEEQQPAAEPEVAAEDVAAPAAPAQQASAAAADADVTPVSEAVPADDVATGQDQDAAAAASPISVSVVGSDESSAGAPAESEGAANADGSVQQPDSTDTVQQNDVATDTPAAVHAVQEELPVQEVIEPEPAAMPASRPEDDAEGSPAERLRAAKAAIAALTGEPVDNNIYAEDIAEEPVDFRPQPIRVPNEPGQERMRSDMMSALGGPQAREEAADAQRDVAEPAPVADTPHQTAASAPRESAPAPRRNEVAAERLREEVPPVPQPVEEPPVINKPQVPDWYRSAQEKAKRSDKRVGSVHRSRYADALDSAVRESSVFFKEANQLVDEETESRLQNMRRGISEVRAPQPQIPAERPAPTPAASPAEAQSGPSNQPQPVPAPMPEAGHSAAPAAETTQPSTPVESPAARSVAPQSQAEPASPSAAPAPTRTPQAQPVHQTIPAVPTVDASAIPEIPLANEENADDGVRTPHQESGNAHKVLDEDPSLGHTVAMKPIPMPVPDAKQDKPAGSREQGRQAASENRAARPVRPRVKLPEVPSANMAPITDTAKQRAPLAQAAEVDGQTAAKSLLSHTIPKIDVASLSGDLGQPVDDAQAPAESKRQNLMEHLPSLSGSVTSDAPSTTGAQDTVVSATGSFTAVSATGAFTPVGDELVADVAPEDRYVDDADDSIEAGGVTESGAVAGPDYVDMPKSRRSRFLSHFHRKHKKDQEEESPQEWLDVEDDFDARTVGRERGDWDSFQQGDARAHTADRRDDDAYMEDAPYDGYEEYDANDGEVPNGTYAQGVIYESSVTYENPISRPTEQQKAYGDDIIDEQPVDESSEPLPEDDTDNRRWEGGAFSGIRSRINRDEPRDDESGSESRRANERPRRENGERQQPRNASRPRPAQDEGRREHVHETIPPFIDADQVERELQNIYEFADDQVETEVWFVALGAQEEANNAGMRSFLATHADELRGAIIVNIEGMGAGTLGFGNSEGVFKHRAPSTRVKRFLHTASQATGIDLVRSDQTWRESAASVAMANGLQAASVMGLDGDKPAYYAQSDDVLENIDEEQVRRNANFLWEFLKAF